MNNFSLNIPSSTQSTKCSALGIFYEKTKKLLSVVRRQILVAFQSITKNLERFLGTTNSNVILL